MTSSNVHAVIRSIDDVKDDLRHEFRKRMMRRMELVETRAKQFVIEDSNYTGKLAQNISTFERVRDDDNMEFGVGVPLDRVPYAAVVEFGSGERSNRPWKNSKKFGLQANAGSAVPVGFPFDAPNVPHNEDDPYDVGGYPKFSAFVGHIEEWMKRKGITPESGDLYTSAVAITAAIIQHGNYAHPYLRPAWFKSKKQIERAAKNAVRNATR